MWVYVYVHVKLWNFVRQNHFAEKQSSNYNSLWNRIKKIWWSLQKKSLAELWLLSLTPYQGCRQSPIAPCQIAKLSFNCETWITVGISDSPFPAVDFNLIHRSAQVQYKRTKPLSRAAAPLVSRSLMYHHPQTFSPNPRQGKHHLTLPTEKSCQIALVVYSTLHSQHPTSRVAPLRWIFRNFRPTLQIVHEKNSLSWKILCLSRRAVRG